jgi:hypothetical protein
MTSVRDLPFDEVSQPAFVELAVSEGCHQRNDRSSERFHIKIILIHIGVTAAGWVAAPTQS